jgi:hypothetical protein
MSYFEEKFNVMSDEEKEKFTDFMVNPENMMNQIKKDTISKVIVSIILTDEKIPNVGKVRMIVPILAAMAMGFKEKRDNIKNQLETFKKFSVISQDIPSLEMIETIKNLLDEL